MTVRLLAIALLASPLLLAQQITTVPNFPEGTAGTEYPPQTFQAQGGNPPYRWTVQQGSLPPGLSLGESTGSITGTPTTAGNYTFRVRVRDDDNDTDTTGNLSIRINAAPSGLTVTACPAPTGVVQQPYTSTATSSGGLPPYAWSITGGALPPGLGFSSGGVLSGTPATAGTFNFTITVRALLSEASRACQVIIAPPLSITTVTLPNGARGVPYSEFLAAAGGAPPYTWSLAGGTLPAGLQLAAGGGITGTPAAEGQFTFSARVTDSRSVPATREFTLTIVSGLTITECIRTPASLNRAYSSTFIAVGGRTPYTWSVLGGSLPAGLALNANNGTVSGTPTQAGTALFTIRVADSGGGAATRACTLVIAPQLRILTTALPAATVGADYSAQIAVDGGVPPYAFSVRSGSLPPGLSLNAATGQITGRPTQAGGSFTIRVTDSLTEFAEQAYTLGAAAELSIAACPPSPAPVNQPYSAVLTAVNAQAPVQWSLRSGTLPAGLSLVAATGQISGQPTLAGLSNFELQVTDGAARTAIRACSIRIDPPALTITTGPLLPAATTGQAYSQSLAATGGRAPYSWTRTSGTFPPGLSLSSSGVISGTPTQTGAFNFVIRAQDQDGVQATQTFGLDVRPAGPAAFSFAGLSATAPPANQIEITVTAPQAIPFLTRGAVNLSFIPDGDLRVSDDPAVQFSTGGRSAPFSIPSGQTRAAPILLQTGTVAGLIRLDINPEGTSGTVFSQTLRLDRLAPSVTRASVVRTASGLEVHVTGFATSRQVTQGNFRFNPASGAGFSAFDVPVQMTEAATAWFNSSSSAQFGSQFLLVQPFQVQGSPSFASIQVTLTNSQGSSTAVLAAVP